MTINADELTYIQGKTASTIRGQRPRLAADAALYHSQTLAPVNSTVPHAFGTGTVGFTLTCTMGTWTNSPVSYGAQWLRDGTAIPGATRGTYLLTPADSTHSLSCTVTATTGGGSAASTSNAIAVT